MHIYNVYKKFKNERFTVKEKYGNTISGLMQVIIDRETGVNYLQVISGNAGGLAPLLDAEGKPAIG